MSKGKELETIIKIAGRVESSLKKSIKDVSSELQRMQDAVKEAATVTDKLGLTINDQSDELQRAKKKYMDYILSGEKSSQQAKELASKIQKLSSELKENQDKMKAAEITANKLSGEFDDMGDKAKGAESGISRFDITLGNIAANGISAVISKAGEAMSSIYGLAEGTREYREDLAKLETAFEVAGHTTEAGTKVYKELFSVFGEEDRAVEAAQQIAKLAKNEKEMSLMTNIATGAWSTWGDSLATESLMEAINSTSKIGTVQGTLTDAIEWTGLNLDTFNEALEGMNGEEERSAFILKTLNSLYDGAADKYRENNASIIEARNAQSDLNDKLATMGETIEPVTTAVQLSFGKVLDKALEVTEKIDFAELADKIGTLTDDVIKLADDGFGWLKNNAGWLIPAVSGLTAAFAAYKTITTAVSIAEEIKNAVMASGATTISATTVATWGLNSAIAVLTSPITIAVAAIAGLVAVGVSLYRNWDNLTEMAAFVKERFSASFTELKDIMLKPFISVYDFIGKLSDKIGNIIGKAQEVGSSIKGKISDVLPFFAAGGFTKGPSIAGEAGTEAVISFNPAYRTQNLSYWEKAGRMLGAFDDSSYLAKTGRAIDNNSLNLSLTGMGGSSYYDMGGVTFAPNVTVYGHADKESVMEAIEAEYPEFIDMLEEWFRGRDDPVYA